jgi:hypothetical protein
MRYFGAVDVVVRNNTTIEPRISTSHLLIIHACILDVVNTVPDEICALLGYYAASSGNPLPTFRKNVSAPSSRVKKWTS